MNGTRWGAVLAVAIGLWGCGGGTEAGVVVEARYEGAAVEGGAVPADALARARRTADDLTSDLGGMVTRTLQSEGAVAAVEVCSTVAQERTRTHEAEGVGVRRITDRLRNPLNAPDPEERAELERMAELHATGSPPQEIVRIVRRDGGRTLEYLRPIMIAQPCLTCHGELATIDPEVQRILRERYPEDAATGYQLGDLRGAVSVRVDLD
jgi:hypothetical protein